MHNTHNALLTAPLAFALTLLPVLAQEAVESKSAAPAWTATDTYPLDTCVVSGRPFAGAKMQVVEVEGRKLKLCSPECADKVRNDPQTHIGKLDRAVVEAQLADYPLDRCPVSGKPLGSMGEPAKIVLDNHLVQLCCKGCTSKAKAKKEEIARSIQAAAYAKQKDTYPLKTCVNTGEKLDPKATIEVMHGPTLLRFCCEDCIAELNKTPAKMVAKLNAARKDKAAPGESQKPATGQPQEDKGHEGHGKQESGGGHEGHGKSGKDGSDTKGKSATSSGGCCGR